MTNFDRPASSLSRFPTKRAFHLLAGLFFFLM